MPELCRAALEPLQATAKNSKLVHVESDLRWDNLELRIGPIPLMNN